MGKTKTQVFVYIAMMTGAMVYAMGVYNVSLAQGKFHYQTLYTILPSFGIEWVFGVSVQFILVRNLVKKIVSKIEMNNNQPLLLTLCRAVLTSSMMCPIMTMFAMLFFDHSSGPIFEKWIQGVILSLPIAITINVCYLGPLVRFIFRKIFDQNSQTNQNVN